ncbi:hypothetical protein A2U01_0005798 [Trifolium medium]|uniref:Uncharacterized protein n=1 Tax=Trifolium medium TaxID=97028 RepID=A0A392MBR6_9FABA|nr:hypothetical protein [Trifolium medium]
MHQTAGFQTAKRLAASEPSLSSNRPPEGGIVSAGTLMLKYVQKSTCQYDEEHVREPFSRRVRARPLLIGPSRSGFRPALGPVQNRGPQVVAPRYRSDDFRFEFERRGDARGFSMTRKGSWLARKEFATFARGGVRITFTCLLA